VDPSNDDKTAPWPSSSILIYGTFGAKTPEGRRFHIRCTAALVAMVLGMILGTILNLAVHLPLAAGAAVPGLAFAFIAWEFRRYVLSLDELARRIQLEAIAWTYLTGLVLAMLAGGFLLVYPVDFHFLNPFWYIFLEPIRAVWLYVVSRRY